MPLGLPPADERTFASLVAEARSRIPRLAPGWTDHNAHDPGITLIELFAHLTELDLYRLGRVTVAERRAFLRWLGVESNGPTVAETVVALARPANEGTPMSLPGDSELTSAPPHRVFTTNDPLTVQPGGIARIFTGERRIYEGDRPVVSALFPAPVAVLKHEGSDPLIIELARPVTGAVSLYLWTGALEHDDEVRRRLQADATDMERDRERRRRFCPPSRYDDWRRHYEVDVAWELRTQAGWTPASQVDDETCALTLSGFVRLGVDAGSPVDAVRVKHVRGRYDVQPTMEAVLFNAVGARHRTRAIELVLGRSDGRAGQARQVPRGTSLPTPGMPLVFAGTMVTVTPDGGTPEEWAVAVDWDRVGSDARTAVLDAEAATLHFGDGRAGRVPPSGAQITLRTRVGGGPHGNVPARTLTRLRTDPEATTASVEQPFSARGGASAPSIADLQARALAGLARPTRAATLTDLERLALETPGVPSGRAYAIAEHHPDFPGLPATGCVTVVVVPLSAGSDAEPTPGFLASVRSYLDRRRPVATELHVVAPTYTRVAVRARLHLFPHADARAAVAVASKRLDAFFHPLTGGPDGGGWPVGRDVYRSEILALLQEISGVHHVDELSLLVGPNREPRCHNVSVCPTALVSATAHDLTIAPGRIR